MIEIHTVEAKKSSFLSYTEQKLVHAAFPDFPDLLGEMIQKQSQNIHERNESLSADQQADPNNLKVYGQYRPYIDVSMGKGKSSFGWIRHKTDSALGNEDGNPLLWLPVTADSLSLTDSMLQIRELLKDGSDLRYIIGTHEQYKIHGTIIRSYSALRNMASPYIWKALNNGTLRADTDFDGIVPVEPILFRKNGQERIHVMPANLETAIMTRYAGLTLGFIRNKLQALTQRSGRSEAFNELRRRVVDLDTQLTTQRNRTLEAMKTLGLIHGHSHDGNFTVEFIRKKTYDKFVKEGYTVNSFPARDGEGNPTVSFNPLDYIEHPDEWMPIVRMIDLDEIASAEEIPQLDDDIEYLTGQIFSHAPIEKQEDVLSHLFFTVTGFEINNEGMTFPIHQFESICRSLELLDTPIHKVYREFFQAAIDEAKYRQRPTSEQSEEERTKLQEHKNQAMNAIMDFEEDRDEYEDLDEDE